MSIKKVFLMSVICLYLLNVSACYADNNDVAHNAVLQGNKNDLTSLLDKGYDINIPDKTGMTLLHYAIISKKTDIANLLVDHGADILKKNNAGKSPLFYSVALQEYEISKLLISKGACEDRKECNKHLIYAVGTKNVELINYMLENKVADVNYSNEQGVTPLHIAALAGDVELVNLLLSYNADIGAKSSDGRTPLDSAKTNGNEEVIKLLGG